MKAWTFRLLVSALGLLLAQCFLSLSGGGSSEAEGFTLAGQVLDSAQRPVSGARIALYDSQASALDSTRSDARGWFAFQRVRGGRYTILATTEGEALAAWRPRIELAASDTLEALSLGRAASLSGGLPAGFPFDQADRVVLLGTPYRGSIASDGSFRLPGIVAGTYAFAVLLRSNFTQADPSVVAALDTLALAPGQSLALDTLRIRSLVDSSTFLVDGFSDCDRLNSRGGEWWSTNDRHSGGSSLVHLFEQVDPGTDSGGCAAHFTFTFGKGAPYPFVGIGTYFLPEVESSPQAVGLESAGGISFRLKGRGASLEVILQSSVAGLVSGQGFDIDTLPQAWTTYTLDFQSDMKDTYDSTDMRSWRQRRKALTHIQFDALPLPGGDSGEVWIDDVRFLPR